ncbi:MAG TPA: hypothetical protein VK701_00440 [Solirubrobacteraceae bacterium]|nr:hypothetical protein [Solirubrobacteraceae bacterium]
MQVVEKLEPTLVALSCAFGCGEVTGRRTRRLAALVRPLAALVAKEADYATVSSAGCFTCRARQVENRVPLDGVGALGWGSVAG